MFTERERINKIEHDARNARYEAAVNAGLIDYVAMMVDVELPEEGEEQNEEAEA